MTDTPAAKSPQDDTMMREQLESALIDHLVTDEDVEMGVKALLRHEPDQTLSEEELERQLEVIVGWLYEVEMGNYLRDMLRRGVIDRLHVPEGVSDPRDIQFVFNEEFAEKAEGHLDAMRRAITAVHN